MVTLKFWVAGIRPKTLITSLSPILIASGWSITQKGYYYFSWFIFSFALVSAISIQIATNFINDAIDFKKGADTEGRLGPTRIVNSGLGSYKQVIQVAVAFLILASVFGLPLVWLGGLPILLIGLSSLFLAYSYTAGPFPLAYLGLGEIFVVMFFGIIPVAGMLYLYNQEFFSESIFLGLLVGSMSSSLILINNMRDVELDVGAGRKTLPIRLGKRFALFLLCAFLVLPPMLSSGWVMWKANWIIAILPLIVLPSCIRLLMDISKEPPSQKYNEFLSRAGRIQLRWTVFVLATLFACSKFGYPLTL